MKKQKKNNKHLLIKTSSRFKFKRVSKGKIKGFEFNQVNTTVRYGVFGLKLLKPLKVTHKNVEAFRATMSRKKLLKKNKHIMWIRGLFNVPVSKKPNEIRMGKGKGPVDHWVLKIKPGKIFVELNYMSRYLARRIFKAITSSLGVPGHIITINKHRIPFLKK